MTTEVNSNRADARFRYDIFHEIIAESPALEPLAMAVADRRANFPSNDEYEVAMTLLKEAWWDEWGLSISGYRSPEEARAEVSETVARYRRYPNMRGVAWKYWQREKLLIADLLEKNPPDDLRESWELIRKPEFMELHKRAHDNVVRLHTEGEQKPENQWGDPADLWGTFNPPDLPRDVLPPVIEEYSFAMGELMGADPAGFAMTALTACAAAIPDSIKLKVKRHDDEWFESARIWTCLIGPPSARKTPIIKAATKPITDIESAYSDQWKREYAKWKETEEGPPPVRQRLKLSDTTVEAVQGIAKYNPNGLISVNDELSAFFARLEKYSSGKAVQADRAFWLEAFNGGNYIVDRVGRGVVDIENLSVNIVGGIQPEAIRAAAKDAADDGLIQRFLPIVLTPAGDDVDAPVGSVAVHYGDLVQKLRDARVAGFLDATLRFDDAAQEVRAEVSKRFRQMGMIETVNRKLASHFGKYDGIFARLCVVWHCIEHADSEAVPDTVSEATARRVASFMEYLRKQSFAFYMGVLDRYDDQDVLLDVAGYILAHDKTVLTRRDLSRGSRAMKKLDNRATDSVIEQLIALDWIVVPDAVKLGDRKKWDVNPLVHRRFADRATEEAKRRKEVQEAIKAASAG